MFFSSGKRDCSGQTIFGVDGFMEQDPELTVNLGFITPGARTCPAEALVFCRIDRWTESCRFFSFIRAGRSGAIVTMERGRFQKANMKAMRRSLRLPRVENLRKKRAGQQTVP